MKSSDSVIAFSSQGLRNGKRLFEQRHPPCHFSQGDAPSTERWMLPGLLQTARRRPSSELAAAVVIPAGVTPVSTHCFMFCFFPVHGENEGEREGEVRAWYDRRSLSGQSDAKTVNAGNRRRHPLCKRQAGFRKAGPVQFFPFVKHEK